MSLTYSKIKKVNGIDESIARLGMLSTQEFDIFPIKKGYPILIYNGAIRDTNGEELKNTFLQSNYAWFTKRVSLAKVAVVARLVKSGKGTYRTSNIEEIHGAVNSNANFAKRFLSECHIEAFEIIYSDLARVDYSIRIKTLSAMSKIDGNIGLEILVPTAIKFSSSTESSRILELREFMSNAGKAGYDIGFFFKQGKSQKSTFCFIGDPYKLFEAEVSSVTTSTVRDLETNVYVDVVKYIKVKNRNNGELIVPYLGLDEHRRKYLLGLHQNSKLNKIKFMAMLYDGSLHYATPI